MSVGENNKAVTDPQGKYYQMEIAGLDLPQAALADKRIRKPRNLPPTKPPLFTHKHYEMIATGAPIISATSAYLKYPDWHEYGNGRFHFQKTVRKRALHRVLHPQPAVASPGVHLQPSRT